MDLHRPAAAPADSVRHMPKVDLHCQLEGTAHRATRAKLALAHGGEAGVDVDELSGRASATAFVGAFDQFSSLLQTPADFELLVYEATRDAVAAGITYREMLFSPGYHLQRGVAFADLWDGLSAGIDAGEADFGVTTRLILDIDATRSVPLVLALLQLIRNTDRQTLAGIGGEASGFVEEDGALRRVVDDANAIGLNTCFHAGYDAAPAQIASLVDAGVDRIGHGARLLESREVAVRVIERDIPVVSCPSSDVAMGVVGELSAHPFREQLRRGVHVTLSSDCPALSGLDLADEYALVGETLGKIDASVDDVIVAGIDAAWLDDSQKRSMREELASFRRRESMDATAKAGS